MTLVFRRTADQQGELDALLTAQQDPSSPRFHQWVTPEQFANRFGLAQADLDLVQSWLVSRGFAVEDVSRSHDRVSFSGTAAQVAAAFGRKLRRYKTGASTHFAPEGELLLPSTLAPLVTAVLDLSDLKPEPQLHPLSADPQFTAAGTGRHLLDPLDVGTQYDINAVYKSGIDGFGQSIAVLGQSWVPPGDPTGMSAIMGKGTGSFSPVLVPNSGVAAAYSGAEAEGSLDLEYAGTIAPRANLFFVYTGDSGTANVYDALAFAVNNNIAPVLSLSYGGCELSLSAAQINSFLQLTQQANAQGQTIVASSGDRGATTCYGSTSLSATQQAAAVVDFPADLPTVTGVGGLQLAPGTFDPSNTQYFSASTGSIPSNYSTLLGYVPEVVWNENALQSHLSSGGGGTSTVVPRPSWQSGVPGIPSGSFRLVPDVALQASVQSPGFLFCTSDTSAWGSGQTSSCTLPGAPNQLTGTYSVAGGTSFGAPILAGMLALLNQSQRAMGQGNINPVLYSLAAQSGTYGAVFHDVVTGNNQCTAANNTCSGAGQAGYTAGSGYDQASGLGSLDFSQLLAAWPSAPADPKLLGTYINASVNNFNPPAGSTQTLSGAVFEVPYGNNLASGAVRVLLDGKLLNPSVPVNARAFSTPFTVPATPGGHVLNVSYAGDSTHMPSQSSAAFTVGSAQATGNFQISATPVSLAYNGTATSTITMTPSSGYNGVVHLSLTRLTTTSSTANSITLCYRVGTISAYGGAGSTTLTLAQGTACNASSTSSAARFVALQSQQVSTNVPPTDPLGRSPGILAAGLFAGAIFLRRSRVSLQLFCGALLILPLSFGLSGCGGSGSSSVAPVTPPPAPLTLNVTISGQDSVNGSINSTATFVTTLTQ